MFENFFIRKKNFEERVRSEVLKQKLQIQQMYDAEISAEQQQHLKTRRDFEVHMQNEVSRIEKEQEIRYQVEITALKEEIKIYKEEQSHILDFWKAFNDEYLELEALGKRLAKKAMMSIEAKKIEFEQNIQKNTQALREVKLEQEKMDRLGSRMRGS
jgi:hypothetical protein